MARFHLGQLGFSLLQLVLRVQQRLGQLVCGRQVNLAFRDVVSLFFLILLLLFVFFIAWRDWAIALPIPRRSCSRTTVGEQSRPQGPGKLGIR
ncbi:MAG: hypothetical protein ACT6RN_27655 [Agrobacterium sp.]|uniref:hypothetical protein n=1 Tax=Agrobacterium sp. TaxID=361 RepID=UPI0040381DB9